MSDSLISKLVADIRAAILVLNQPHGGGHSITPEQADERARGIAQSLIVNYDLRELPGPYTVTFGEPDWTDKRITGPMFKTGHSWSCKCSDCEDVREKTKERL